LILVDDNAENLISVASGANHTLSPKEISALADQIRSADVLMLQLETPMDTVCAAAQIAAEAGVPVILDPAPAAPLPDGLLRNVAYLTPNESEAERLTGLTVCDEASARQAAAQLRKAGANGVIVTLGANGALVAGPDGMELIPSNRIDAVDTTAAGDAFNGGLAHGLASGLNLDRAVRQACCVGALSATRLGAQPSLPTYAELRRFVEMP
jgi:ribokinase